MMSKKFDNLEIEDPKLLSIFESIPREEFVPEAYKDHAYDDGPLPIGYGQTISQPYIVGYMTEKLALNPTDRVLEIGTGCGYQTAILSKMVKEVFTVEIIAEFSQRAQSLLSSLGCKNIQFKVDDGHIVLARKSSFRCNYCNGSVGRGA